MLKNVLAGFVGHAIVGGAAMVVVRSLDSMAPQAVAPTRAASRPPHWFKDSREVLAVARATSRTQVSILIAAASGQNAAVAREVARLGGTVAYRNDDVSYLRAKVPIQNASELVEFGGVESAAMDVDDSYPSRVSPDGVPSPNARLPQQGQQRDTGAASASRWPPRAGSRPLDDPFSPIKDLGADQFLKDHPTYDGRGVTVAVLDGSFDFLLPELQTATTLDGKTVRKVADFLNATDPMEDSATTPQWVDMRATAVAQDGRLSFRGKTFAAPHDGSFRIGFFNERAFSSPANAAYINKDIDRDGNPPGDDGLFGVLWDEATNSVWVDAGRDLSFANDKAMTDYVVHEDVGVFGKDDPKTPVRESIGFVVQTDRMNKFISINVGMYQHSTMVVGALAANHAPRGRYDGVAPGARLVSITYGIGVAHGMIEALIRAFTHPLVDVVLLEQDSNVSGLYTLADGRHPASIVSERLIERYHKALLVPGGNAGGLDLVSENGLPPKAFSIGGYQSKESYRVNFGIVPANDDNMHWGGLSHGPAGDGALKPDVLSPSGSLGGDPGYRDGGARKGLYRLPPGYTIGGGTSEATPVATGAVALLVSAAKQAKVPYDVDRLRLAITSSARRIGHLGAYEQGNGLIQVGAAWELLRKLPAGPLVTITSRAPVKTVLSSLLATPDEGVGIFEREGWAAGARGERTITFTRTSGPRQPMTFSLAWQGNDGTFESPATITLPLGSPVPLRVTIATAKVGVHSAILSLDHPSTPGHVYRLLNTVVAAHQLDASNGYRVSEQADIARPGDGGFFIDVPPGVEALWVDLKATKSPVRVSYLAPDGSTATGSFAAPTTDHSRAIVRPMPGVWEIEVWNGNDGFNFDPDTPEPAPPTPVSMTARLLGFSLAASPPESPIARPGAVAVPVTATNRFAATSAAVTSVSLARRRDVAGAINGGEQRVFEISVPKGSERVSAHIDARQAGVDLDLYLFDCSGKSCEPRDRSASPGSDETVTALEPKPGKWLVIVDAFLVPEGKAEFSYSDLFVNPTLGAIRSADVADDRAVGASWSAMTNAWVAGDELPGRRIVALVELSSPLVRASFRSASGFTGFVDAPVPLGRTELLLGGAVSLR